LHDIGLIQPCLADLRKLTGRHLVGKWACFSVRGGNIEPANGKFIVLRDNSKGVFSSDCWLCSKKVNIGGDGIEHETIESHEGTSTMSYFYVYVSGKYRTIVYEAQYGAHSYFEKSY
jgi:hypothetical protein